MVTSGAYRRSASKIPWRLDNDEFQSQFSAAWASLFKRFLKLECWQAYREIAASESQDAYNRGDFAGARGLLREEAEADRPLYADIRASELRRSAIPLLSFLAASQR